MNNLAARMFVRSRRYDVLALPTKFYVRILLNRIAYGLGFFMFVGLGILLFSRQGINLLSAYTWGYIALSLGLTLLLLFWTVIRDRLVHASADVEQSENLKYKDVLRDEFPFLPPSRGIFTRLFSAESSLGARIASIVALTGTAIAIIVTMILVFVVNEWRFGEQGLFAIGVIVLIFVSIYYLPSFLHLVLIRRLKSE